MFAETNRVGLALKKETSWGEEPSSPVMAEVRYTGESLVYEKQQVESQTIRADRMIDTACLVGFNAQGGFSFELAYLSSLIEVIEAAVCSAQDATFSLTGLTLDVDSSAKTFTKVGGTSFITSGVQVGQNIRTGGFAAAGNNGIFKVSAVAADVITCATATGLVTVTGDAGCTIEGRMARNYTTPWSFLIEKQFTDADLFEQFLGERVNNLSLNIAAGEIITGEVDFIGKEARLSDSSIGTTTAVSPAVPLTGSANVGTITLDGAALASAIEEITLQLANNLRAQKVIGSLAAAGVGYGRFEAKGTLRVFFEDFDLLEQIIDHETVAISWRMTDVDGNVIVVTLPKVFLSKGDPQADAGNKDVMQEVEFMAVRDAVTDCSIQFDFLPVIA